MKSEIDWDDIWEKDFAEIKVPIEKYLSYRLESMDIKGDFSDLRDTIHRINYVTGCLGKDNKLTPEVLVCIIKSNKQLKELIAHYKKNIYPPWLKEFLFALYTKEVQLQGGKTSSEVISNWFVWVIYNELMGEGYTQDETLEAILSNTTLSPIIKDLFKDGEKDQEDVKENILSKKKSFIKSIRELSKKINKIKNPRN